MKILMARPCVVMIHCFGSSFAGFSAGITTVCPELVDFGGSMEPSKPNAKSLTSSLPNCLESSDFVSFFTIAVLFFTIRNRGENR